jgi:hypothetical protein
MVVYVHHGRMAQSWPLTSIYCQNLELWDFTVTSPVCFYSVVVIGHGATLPLPFICYS